MVLGEWLRARWPAAKRAAIVSSGVVSIGVLRWASESRWIECVTAHLRRDRSAGPFGTFCPAKVWHSAYGPLGFLPNGDVGRHAKGA